MQRTLQCPHCRGQMNTTGNGALPDSFRYICLQCPPGQQYKELLSAVVVRTGGGGFGFVGVQALPHLGQVYFSHQDVRGQVPQVGDRVLVLLAQGPRGQVVRAVYPLSQARPYVPPVRTQPRPQARPSFGLPPTPPPPPRPRPVARRWGVVATVKGPDWGFVRDTESGQELFVHISNCVGGQMLPQGQLVVYTPHRNDRGPCAVNVQAA